MNELKEIYGIEMTADEKKTLAISILGDVWERTANVLDTATNKGQRIDALKKQEAVKYLLAKVGQ